MLNCCLKPFYILQQIQTNILNLSKFHNCQNLRWIRYRDGFAAISNQHDHHRGRLERRPEQIWAELQRQKCLGVHSDGCGHYVWKQWRSTCKFFLNDRHFILFLCFVHGFCFKTFLYILASLLLLWMKVMKLIFLCPDFKLNIISEEWKI